MKRLLPITIVMLFTTFTYANTINMAPIISYLLFDSSAITTPEQLEGSDIGDSCINEDGTSGVVVKDTDPFGNVIPNTATCE